MTAPLIGATRAGHITAGYGNRYTSVNMYTKLRNDIMVEWTAFSNVQINTCNTYVGHFILSWSNKHTSTHWFLPTPYATALTGPRHTPFQLKPIITHVGSNTSFCEASPRDSAIDRVQKGRTHNSWIWEQIILPLVCIVRLEMIIILVEWTAFRNVQINTYNT